MMLDLLCYEYHQITNGEVKLNGAESQNNCGFLQNGNSREMEMQGIIVEYGVVFC